MRVALSTPCHSTVTATRASCRSSSGSYSIPRWMVDNHLNSGTIFHHSSDSSAQILRIWCWMLGVVGCRGGTAWLKVINCMHFVSDRFKIFILYHVHVCFCIKDGWFWFCLVQKIFVYCLIETSPSIQSRLVTTASFFPRRRHTTNCGLTQCDAWHVTAMGPRVASTSPVLYVTAGASNNW